MPKKRWIVPNLESAFHYRDIERMHHRQRVLNVQGKGKVWLTFYMWHPRATCIYIVEGEDETEEEGY